MNLYIITDSDKDICTIYHTAISEHDALSRYYDDCIANSEFEDSFDEFCDSYSCEHYESH